MHRITLSKILLWFGDFFAFFPLFYFIDAIAFNQ